MTKGKKNERKNEILGTLFSEYLNSEEAMKEPLRKAAEDFTTELYEKVTSGKFDPYSDDFGEMHYNSMKAGFFAGFEIAKALLG